MTHWNPRRPSKFEYTTYHAYLGSYIGKYVLLGVDYSHTDIKDTGESKFSSFSYSSEVDQDDFGLSVKYLMAFRNNMAFGILARGEYGETKYEWDTEYDKSFQLTPEFYFNQKTSLQLNLAYTDYESDKYSNVYGVSFHTFLGRTFAVEASLGRYEFKSSDPGTNDSSVTLVGLAGEMWF